MTGIKATLINELEKLYKNKKVLIVAILSIIFIILGQVFILVVRNKNLSKYNKYYGQYL
mgnify:CR=1 FL=1